MNKDKPSTSKASDHETLVNPPAKRRRPDARMSKINVEFGQSRCGLLTLDETESASSF